MITPTMTVMTALFSDITYDRFGLVCGHIGLEIVPVVIANYNLVYTVDHLMSSNISNSILEARFPPLLIHLQFYHIYMVSIYKLSGRIHGQYSGL